MSQQPHSADITSVSFDTYSLEDWQALATKSLRGDSLASLAHTTANGLMVEPLYSERPLAHTHLTPPTLQRWDNRLSVLGDNPIQQNVALLGGLAGGISSAQIHISSAEYATPISVDSLNQLVENVQLELVPLSFMAGSQYAPLANAMDALWSANAVSTEQAACSFNADPIGTLASTGNASVAMDELLQQMNSLAITYQSHINVNTVCVNATAYHNAGASAQQELTACIASATIYMESLINAGMTAQAAHDTIVFQLSCDADVLGNVSKLRALKVLWNHVANELGVQTPQLKLVVETSKRMQSLAAPWVNHLRNVSAATAAAMCGAQTIIVHPHNYVDDNFIDSDIELSARMARNIGIILSEESAMTFVHDPMAGSYAIEHVTAALTEDTWSALQTLESKGGLIQSLEAGQWQSEIASHQKLRVKRLREEQDIQVTVNRYVSDEHRNSFVSASEKATDSSSTSQPSNTQKNTSLADTSAGLTICRDAQSFEVSS